MGTPHGQIVDGAAHRQLADVTTGKEQRVDHEAVGGHGQSVAQACQLGQFQPRLVLELLGKRGEFPDEDVIDQVLNGLAAASVGLGHRAGDKGGKLSSCRIAHDSAWLVLWFWLSTLPPPY